MIDFIVCKDFNYFSLLESFVSRTRMCSSVQLNFNLILIHIATKPEYWPTNGIQLYSILLPQLYSGWLRSTITECNEQKCDILIQRMQKSDF
jgi:hypothetical protein